MSHDDNWGPEHDEPISYEVNDFKPEHDKPIDYDLTLKGVHSHRYEGRNENLNTGMNDGKVLPFKRKDK